MTQVRHRKEQKIRTSSERKLASNLEVEEPPSFQSTTPPMQNLQTSLAQSNAGKSLDSSLRSELEPQFGHDFANVRVHADAQADQMAKSLNANAFVAGQDVYFREGMFKPDSGEGKQLLAHELTHTIQQSRGTSSSTDLSVSKSGDPLEQATQTQANAVMNARGASITPGTVSNMIQREIHDPSLETSTTTSTTASSSETTDASPIPNANSRNEFDAATRAFDAGRYLEAAQAFEALARRFPAQERELLYNACQAYDRLGADANLGTRRVRREVEDAYADPSNRQQARQAAMDGVQAYQNHEYARAAELFQTAYRVVPAPEFQFNIGMAFLNAGHPADALEAFRLARAGGVEVPQRLMRQAENERRRTQDISGRDLDALGGSEADAIDEIVRDASVSDAGVLFHSATRAFLDQHYDDAIHQFQDIQATLTAATGRPDVNMFWNEARARFRAEDYAGALPLYRQALSLG
jgi:tetratricopeptide (TPR) repeat protein